MVKNNGIPIEVKKPVETVYEIKNETPSFEEFMETYEADEKVINSYRDEVEYVNGWTSKGSGPCYVCNKPTKWINLYMSCPGVNDSGERCTNTRKTYWYHSTDSKQTQISNKSYIRCSYCSANYHMSQWAFSCSAHRGDYWGVKRLSFRASMSMVLGLDHYEDLVDDVIVRMSNHKDEWPNG